jgi:hypothetical protein
MTTTDNGPHDAGVWDAFDKHRDALARGACIARGRWLEAERERLVEQSTGVIAVQRDELARLRARVAVLEGVVERLPKTADGVPIFDVDGVWHVHPEVDNPMFVRGVVYDLVNRKAFVVYQGAEYLTEIHCYSTRAAAEAAAKAGG